LDAAGLAGGGANWAEAVAEHARSATAAIANRVWSIGVPAGGTLGFSAKFLGEA
jgi:hypothetical protein